MDPPVGAGQTRAAHRWRAVMSGSGPWRPDLRVEFPELGPDSVVLDHRRLQG